MKRVLAPVVFGVLVGWLLIGAAELRRSGAALEPRWIKGNLHTHSLWSDGNEFPEMILDWYKRQGYDFLAMSDHNVLSQGDRWVKTQTVEKKHPGAMAKYLQRFGENWVEQRGEGKDAEVRLKPLGEYRAHFEDSGKFLLIQAEEITDKIGSMPVHRCATNLLEVIKPRGGNSVREIIENNLQAVLEQEERTGQPMLPHLNHPNFRWGVTAEDIIPVAQERFFEIYNGHPGVNQRGDELHASMDRMWDIINTVRIAEHRTPPLLGVGTDDSHKYNLDGVSGEKRWSASGPGRGWVMVRATHLTPESIIKAMKAGDFYASSGVTLKDVRFDGSTLSVEVLPQRGADYTIEFIGSVEGVSTHGEPTLNSEGQELALTRRYTPEIGKVLHKARGASASYTLTGRELYVRAAVTSSQLPAEPAWEGQQAQAWTQPVGWHKRVATAD